MNQNISVVLIFPPCPGKSILKIDPTLTRKSKPRGMGPICMDYVNVLITLGGIGNPPSFHCVHFFIRPYKNDVTKNFRKFEKQVLRSCRMGVV